MTKHLWIDIRPWRKELATAAIESGADAVVVETSAPIRELGRILIVAPDGDLIPGTDVFETEIHDRVGEKLAVELATKGLVIVTTTDWTIIPLENLVAQSDRIIATVQTANEAEVALAVLERGVHGVLLKTDDPQEIRNTARVVKGATEEIQLIPFTVTGIRNVGMGDRVCIDTCSLLSEGQGVLVGDTSLGFLLMHAETLENPYVAPRPFRVNAGAAHAYTLTPSGKTAYLSELGSGDKVLVVDENGKGMEAIIGRVKIERRPLVRIEAEAEGKRISLIVQNAETIRLVAPSGSAISVVDLKIGDTVLGHFQKGGRHFGMAVNESIIEK